MRYSLPQNIVRYSNGTLVKLTVSDHQFISYDYDPETDTGTYTPTSIKITAKYAGNLTYSKWQYTKDNSGWVDIPASNDLGITITSTTLTILPSSSLFDKVNSFIMFRVVATDNDSGEEYTDTAEIERIVDYIILYRKQQTDIDQTADKIALIASDEQLRQYGTENTVVSDLAALKVTAQGISSTVESHTTALAGKANTTDVNTALARKADTTYVADNYSTKTQTAQEITQAVSSKVGEDEVISLISQSADAIRLLARTLTWTSDNSSLTEAGFLTVIGGQIGGWTLQDNELFAGSATGNYMKLNPTLLETRSSDAHSYLYTRIRNGGFSHAAQNKNSDTIQTTTVYGPAYDYSGDVASGSVACYKEWSLMRNAGGTLVHRFCGGDSYKDNAAFWYGLPVYMKSSLKVAGTKSREAETEDYGSRLLYCYETASPMFGDVGEGVIGEDGKAYIAIDPIFSETVNLSQYQVFLQKYGEGEAYVSERNPSYFVVSGTAGLSFGWELKAKQKDYEQQRLDEDRTFGAAQTAYGEYGAWHIQDVQEERMNAI